MEVSPLNCCVVNTEFGVQQARWPVTWACGLRANRVFERQVAPARLLIATPSAGPRQVESMEEEEEKNLELNLANEQVA